jgi:HEAT repeat protein
MNLPALLVALAIASSSGQTTPRRPAGTAATPPPVAAPSPWRGTPELAKGWTALAAGRAGEAETIADGLLHAGTRRHDALQLKIAARVQVGRTDAALDAYEEALQGAAAEDVYLLQPVARGALDTLSRSADARVRIAALGLLAQAGDRSAATALSETAAADNTGMTDLALVDLKNPQAIARLQARVNTPGPRADVSEAIDALAKAKTLSAIPAIVAALDPARPVPTRLSAARALGRLDARDAIPQLQRALRDPDPAVQMTAAAALSRLGDQSGAEILQQMESSPIADVRMMLAEAAAPQNPSGAWVATATAAMNDADPLVRLNAAALVVKYSADPKPGLAVLDSALADPNPALRLAAADRLDEVPVALLGNDLPSLRKWLRDPSPEVRMAAAAALLRLAGGIE